MCTHFTNKLNGYKELLDNLYEHSKAESDKSARLKKINFLNNFLTKEENTLSEFLKYTQKFYLKISENHRNFALKVQSIIEIQKKLIDEYKKKAKNLFYSFDEVEKDYAYHLLRLKKVILTSFGFLIALFIYYKISLKKSFMKTDD